MKDLVMKSWIKYCDNIGKRIGVGQVMEILVEDVFDSMRYHKLEKILGSWGLKRKLDVFRFNKVIYIQAEGLFHFLLILYNFVYGLQVLPL